MSNKVEESRNTTPRQRWALEPFCEFPLKAPIASLDCQDTAIPPSLQTANGRVLNSDSDDDAPRESYSSGGAQEGTGLATKAFTWALDRVAGAADSSVVLSYALALAQLYLNWALSVAIIVLLWLLPRRIVTPAPPKEGDGTASRPSLAQLPWTADQLGAWAVPILFLRCRARGPPPLSAARHIAERVCRKLDSVLANPELRAHGADLQCASRGALHAALERLAESGPAGLVGDFWVLASHQLVGPAWCTIQERGVLQALRCAHLALKTAAQAQAREAAKSGWFGWFEVPSPEEEEANFEARDLSNPPIVSRDPKQ